MKTIRMMKTADLRLSVAGDTPIIAATRCFVASRFGEEVSDV